MRKAHPGLIFEDSVMKSPRRTHGFTMIEMLIVITIISIIGLIAMPVYNNYIATSREGVLVTNITTIEIFQEDFRLRNGAYAVDLANIAAITAAIGWDPQAADGTTYVIADGDGTTYSVTGTDIEGRAICIAFPARTRC